MTNTCMNCDYADKDRKNCLGQIRCKRLHMFVSPEDSCRHHYNKKDADILYQLFNARKEQT